MDKLYSPTVAKKIMNKHHFKTSKRYGQNFLIDENIIHKIVDAVDINSDDLVIEIGPGIGTLTAELANLAKKVKAIEIDEKLIPILKENLIEYNNIDIINQDFLNTNLNEIISSEQGYSSVKVIGNLPYYITTPIIMKILEEKLPVNSITIMVQKEVADRLNADPGGKDYGALSVAVQYYCQVTSVAQVPRTVFIPKPNVDSTVIRLDVRQTPIVKVNDEKVFFKMVKAGFSQRRKTLINSLSHFLNQPKEQIKKILIQSDIDPSRRAETLSLQDFATIANNSIK